MNPIPVLTVLLGLISVFDAKAAVSDSDLDFLKERDSGLAIQFANTQSIRTLRKYGVGKKYTKTLHSILDQNKVKLSIRTGILVQQNLYKVMPSEIQVISVSDFRKGDEAWKTWIRASDIDSGKVVIKNFSCLRPEMVHCMISYSLDGQQTFFKEFDLRPGAVFANPFEIKIPGANRAVWVDPDTLMIAVPGLTSTSAKDDGSAAEIRIWKRGQPLLQSQIILTSKADDMGLLAWEVEQGKSHYPLIARWWGSPLRGQTYYYVNGKLHTVNHPQQIMTFHAVHQDSLVLQVFEDWTDAVSGQKFQANDVIAVKLTSTGAPGAASLVLRPKKSQGLNDIVNTGDALVLSYSEDLVKKVAVLKSDASGWTQKTITATPVGGGHRDLDLGTNDEFSSTIFLRSQSVIAPPSIHELDTAAATLGDLRQLQPLFDASGIESEILWAKSQDGTQIPYRIFGRKKDLEKKRGNRPTLIYGYGAFSISLTQTYSPLVGKHWLEKGGIFVMAHTRGGSEYGHDWHLQGSGPNKHKSIEDAVAVARDLVTRGYTKPSKLGIYGASAGGLLATSAMIAAPDAFGAVVSQFGIMDVFQVPEFRDEYGDSNDPVQKSMMDTYSPFQAVRSGVKYPPFFAITSTQDWDVHPLHTRRMIAKMQSLGIKKAYMHERSSGGHTERTDVQDALMFRFFQKNLRLR
ncbi:MAG: S9 family peptidase [Bdellovibrionales bacterium]|nr:S9 family peptidase [Bdellovibrionales bacterium]